MSLHIDEINKLAERIRLLKPYEVMDRKKEIMDWVEEYLMYAWTMGVEDITNGTEGQDALGRKKPTEADFRKARERDVAGKTITERLDGWTGLGDGEAVIRVADTEGHRLYGEAAAITARKNGAKTKTWHTMLDERVRDLHDYLEGMTVPIDGVFVTYNGDETMFPGQFGIPEEDINCRCFVTYK